MQKTKTNNKEKQTTKEKKKIKKIKLQKQQILSSQIALTAQIVLLVEPSKATEYTRAEGAPGVPPKIGKNKIFWRFFTRNTPTIFAQSR
jgi:hypothetical protein